MWRFLEKLILPFALLAGALGLVYWYWTSTPSYALTRVVDSVKDHDAETFEHYVDIDSLSSRAFDQLVDGPAADRILAHKDGLTGIGILRFFKRDLVGIAHERLCKLIADPKVDLDAASSGTVEALRRCRISPGIRQSLVAYGLTKDGFRGVKYLNVQGSTALLGLDFYSPLLRSNYIVEFRMEDEGGFWRIVEITNFDELVNRYLQTRSRLPV